MQLTVQLYDQKYRLLAMEMPTMAVKIAAVVLDHKLLAISYEHVAVIALRFGQCVEFDFRREIERPRLVHR